MTLTVHCGEALEVLRGLPDDSEDACVTSPPYWRMRDYGHVDQLGLEEDVDAFVDRLATIFDEVRRVLKPTGTAWVNLGDSYVGNGGRRVRRQDLGRRYMDTPRRKSEGLKRGDLALVPARFALEVQRRGWWVRSEVIWYKTNATPDSCSSRPGVSHEHIWMLSKRPPGGYYYDAEALRTPLRPSTIRAWGSPVRRDAGNDPLNKVKASRMARSSMRFRRPAVDENGNPKGARRGSVWAIAVAANRGRVEHFAMQAHEIAAACVLASTPYGGRVLDPFLGAGTTAIAARRLGRDCTGIEIVPATAALARRQYDLDAPLISRVEPSSSTLETLDLFADPEPEPTP